VEGALARNAAARSPCAGEKRRRPKVQDADPRGPEDDAHAPPEDEEGNRVFLVERPQPGPILEEVEAVADPEQGGVEGEQRVPEERRIVEAGVVTRIVGLEIR
jgi:hypothetical protein